MLRLLFQSKPNHQYPLMRDPHHSPKCYEMTEQERLEAVQRVEVLLKEQESEEYHGYYGA